MNNTMKVRSRRTCGGYSVQIPGSRGCIIKSWSSVRGSGEKKTQTRRMKLVSCFRGLGNYRAKVAGLNPVLARRGGGCAKTIVFEASNFVKI